MISTLLGDDVTGRIHLADNLEVLRTLPSACIDLIHIDPPFNTGKVQLHTQLKTVRSAAGDRVGFQGRRYESNAGGKKRFAYLSRDKARPAWLFGNVLPLVNWRKEIPKGGV